MDHIFAGIAIKGIISLLLMIGALAALFIGRGLYRSGVGLSEDGSHVEVENIKASLKTVGSVVMATSVAWAALGWIATPEVKNGDLVVESSPPPELLEMLKKQDWAINQLNSEKQNLQDQLNQLSIENKGLQEKLTLSTPAYNELKSKLTSIRAEIYHTGKYDKGFGPHYTCSERRQDLAARVCGANYQSVNLRRLKIHSGDTCGYEYFITACVQK